MATLLHFSIPSEIQNRKEYLRYAVRSSSDFQVLATLGCHVDGGTDINTLERILDMIEDDHMIRRLTARTKAIEDFLSELDEESYNIINLRYIKRQGLQHVSNTSVNRHTSKAAHPTVAIN